MLTLRGLDQVSDSSKVLLIWAQASGHILKTSHALYLVFVSKSGFLANPLKLISIKRLPPK